MLRAVPGGVAERFQEAPCNKNRNLVRLEAQIPRSLGRAQTRGGNFPTEKLRLLGYLIHNENTVIKNLRGRGRIQYTKTTHELPCQNSVITSPSVFILALKSFELYGRVQ